MPVSVAPPVAKRVTQWDEFSGRFEAVASVEVRARVSGFIEELHFKDGQLVNVGDPLFTIDKRPYEIAVESAKAEVARNKAQVGLAELQVQRGASLITSRTITEQENDQRKANLDVARAQLKAAEAGLRSAELNLDWTDVRAPIAGRISDRKVDAGNLIQGGQTGASLLATIVTLDPIRFAFDVSETDYLRYTRLFLSGELASSREKNPVRIRLADETEWTRTGRVDFVDNTFALRPGAAVRRRVRRLPDSRYGHRLRPVAQDRVYGRRRQRGQGQVCDPGPDRRWAEGRARWPRGHRPGGAGRARQPDGAAGRQGRAAKG